MLLGRKQLHLDLVGEVRNDVRLAFTEMALALTPVCSRYTPSNTDYKHALGWNLQNLGTANR